MFTTTRINKCMKDTKLMKTLEYETLNFRFFGGNACPNGDKSTKVHIMVYSNSLPDKNILLSKETTLFLSKNLLEEKDNFTVPQNIIQNPRIYFY